jgi:NtrC-family two-component system response regulator AlgB
LEDDVKNGRFREDLFFRLNVITLTVPPLRERPEDALLYANHFLYFFKRRQGRSTLEFSASSKLAIQSHSWPGNLRELSNAVERAVILCPGSVIEPSDLGLATSFTAGANGGGVPGITLGAKISLEQIEREHIARVVADTESFESAARILGIDVTTLQRKRKKYGLT